MFIMHPAFSFLMLIAVGEGSICSHNRNGWVCSHSIHGTVVYRHADSKRSIEFGNIKKCPGNIETPDFGLIFQDGLESQPHTCCFYGEELAETTDMLETNGFCTFEFHYKGGSNAEQYNDALFCRLLRHMSLQLLKASYQVSN